MITKEKLQIFDSYDGEIDRLAQVGSGKEKKLFDNNHWSLIESFYQDIELINKGLVDKLFIKQTIRSMEANCDSAAFKMLSSKLVNEFTTLTSKT